MRLSVFFGLLLIALALDPAPLSEAGAKFVLTAMIIFLAMDLAELFRKGRNP